MKKRIKIYLNGWLIDNYCPTLTIDISKQYFTETTVS